MGKRTGVCNRCGAVCCDDGAEFADFLGVAVETIELLCDPCYAAEVVRRAAELAGQEQAEADAQAAPGYDANRGWRRWSHQGLIPPCPQGNDSPHPPGGDRLEDSN